MATRRQFLQTGLALSGLALGPPRLHAAADALPQPYDSPAQAHTPFKVLVDKSFAGTAMFGAEAARRGASVRFFDGDVGSVWMNEIEPRWRQERVPIAGLSGVAPLFCLELLARGYGMRVVYRFTHSLAPQGEVRHTLTGGPDALIEWERRLALSGTGWLPVAAELATSCPRALPPLESLDLPEHTQRAGAERTLTSWLIA